MTDTPPQAPLRSAYAEFRAIDTGDDWFEVYEIAPDLYVFHEPRHYEETIVNLVIGEERAALIDTGCGIGNLRHAVERVTDKPVIVINTHTHLDHLGGNRQFDDIAIFDHPLSRRVAAEGVVLEIVRSEILMEALVTPPWPRGFDSQGEALPPFAVGRWLREGDWIDLGGRALEVIHTPGESPDHLCLLDRSRRILFCGDILLKGPVWTHLEGGSLTDLLASYRKLMGSFGDFDHLMPGHNVPWLDKGLLPEALAGAEAILSGEAEYREIVDPWQRRLRQYSFGSIDILTPAL